MEISGQRDKRETRKGGGIVESKGEEHFKRRCKRSCKVSQRRQTKLSIESSLLNRVNIERFVMIWSKAILVENV